jgi:hypothetical protein
VTTFKVERVKGRMRPFRVVRATTEATGKKGAVRHVSEVEVNLEIGGEGDVDPSFDKAIEVLWPGAADVCKRIGSDESATGQDSTARGKLPDLTVDLYAMPEGGKPVFHLPAATCRGRPKLKIDENGTATMALRLSGRFQKDDLARLTHYIEADVWMTAAPAQVDMAEIVEAKAEPAKKKAGKRVKTPPNGESGEAAI